MMKKILIGLGILIVLAGGVVWYVASNLDAIVKGVIESAGTKALGTPVTVGAVEISLKEGRARVTDLAVANPQGFSEPHFVAFGELSASIDYKRAAVREIQTIRPQIHIEQKGNSTNIQQITEGMEKSDPASAPETASSEPEAETVQGEAVELTIDLIRIEDARVDVIAEGEEPSTVTISEMRFTDLQGTASEISSQVIRQLLAQVTEAAADALVQAGIERAQQAAEQKLSEKLGEEAGKLSEEIGGAVKSLLNRGD